MLRLTLQSGVFHTTRIQEWKNLKTFIEDHTTVGQLTLACLAGRRVFVIEQESVQLQRALFAQNCFKTE